MLNWLGSVFKGIGKVADSIGNADERELNRLRYRVEAAMQYIRVDEKSGEYAGISNQRQAKLKIHFSRRVFDAS